MFAIHQIAISTPQRISSDAEARQFLAEYVANEGSQLYGRWYTSARLLHDNRKKYYTWYNGEKHNFIPLNDSSIPKYLDLAETLQSRVLSDISDKLNGAVVLPAGEVGRVLNIPVAKTEVDAQNKTIENLRLMNAWRKLSKHTSIQEARNQLLLDTDSWIMLDQVATFCSLIKGEWVFESMFYCDLADSSDISYFRKFITNNNEYKNNAYLFAVELTI